LASRYDVRLHRGASQFLSAARDWLLEREAENNIVLSIAHLLTTADHPFREPFYLASITERGKLVGCGVAAPPDGIELTELPEGAAAELVPGLAGARPDLPWVGAARRVALEFAHAWAAKVGGNWQLRHEWMEFRLDEVVAPRAAPGRLRLGNSADWPLLRTWAPGYAADTNTPVDVSGFLERRLRRRELHVWDHDGAKSFVTMSGNTPNAVQISSVYTPREFRGNGYASNAVAAASQGALAAGASFCVLFADPEPAQPARIYRSIGYRPIRDHLVIVLSR
jgi:GNAT superfamily N-acetyltransferase